MAPVHHPLHGIFWIMVTGLLSVCIYALARELGAQFAYSPFQIVFFYNLAGLVFYLPFVVGRRVSLRSDRLPLYALRGALEFGGFSLSIYGLQHLVLPVHTALSFTSPLFGSLAAVLLLKERNNIHRWISLAIGFVGVILVSRPGTAEFNESALYVLGGAVCFAFCGICIKKLTLTEPTPRIAFYMMLMTALIAAPFAYPYWKPVTLEALPLLVLLGMMVATVQVTVGLAYSKAEMTVILPFNFLNLIWSSLIALVFFGEWVDGWTIAGGAVIVAAAFYSIRHASRVGMGASMRATAGGS